MFITLLIIFLGGVLGAVEVGGMRVQGFLVEVEVDELGDGVRVFVEGVGIWGEVGRGIRGGEERVGGDMLEKIIVDVNRGEVIARGVSWSDAEET